MQTEKQILQQAMFSTKLSRLLAQENISVHFDEKADTASFEPINRILTFPYSTAFMDHDIHELFMMHEISHALHLPVDAIKQAKDFDIEFDYVNVVVDIRDERLIKAKYPGSVRAFNAGYEKLLDQGFFGSKQSINYRKFVDRLNVYAKVGIKTGHFIKMSAEEHAFYERCMKAETYQEVLELSKELRQMNGRAVSDEELSMFLEELFKDAREKMPEDASEEDLIAEMERIKQENAESRVQEMFNAAFKQTSLNNVVMYNYVSVGEKELQIVSAEEYVKLVRARHSSIDELIISVREMRGAIRQSVDSMVRVFESRKAAARYKNAKVSDTGLVDVNKVHRFQIDEKIFRRSMKIHNSKNHGYVIMCDLSGSMQNVVRDVFEQVIVIVEFFRRVQVPYKVIGFGASLNSDLGQRFYQEQSYVQPVKNPHSIVYPGSQPLVEFLNHTQTTKDHNTAVYGMLHKTGFSLGGTPTGRAIHDAEHICKRFFDKYGVDKKHLIIMTDGEPTDLTHRSYSYRHSARSVILVDGLTKTNIVTHGNADYSSINAIGKILERRHGIKLTSICITKSLSETTTSAFVSASIDEVTSKFWRQKGYAKIVDPYTNNDVYFAKPFNVDTDITSFAIDPSKTASQMARAMLANMKTVKKSRSFLNALTETLS